MNQKEEILKVGLKLFSSQPFSATGIRQITQEAGLPTGSFHYYFKNKEDFALGVLDYFFTQELPSSTDNAKFFDHTIPAKEKLVFFFQTAIAYHINNSTQEILSSCVMGNLAQEVATKSDVVAEKISQFFKKSHFAIETILSMGEKDNSINFSLPSVQLAKFLFDAYEGALMRRKIEKSNEPLNEFLKTIEMMF